MAVSVINHRLHIITAQRRLVRRSLVDNISSLIKPMTPPHATISLPIHRRTMPLKYDALQLFTT